MPEDQGYSRREAWQIAHPLNHAIQGSCKDPARFAIKVSPDPAPVDTRHKASESFWLKPERLSYAKICESIAPYVKIAHVARWPAEWNPVRVNQRPEHFAER
jgi:hypothetical protein